MLDGLTQWAPAPLPRMANERQVEATEDKFTGFVFKIQANMDPKHRDRIAFMRIVSGTYNQGMKMNHVRLGKQVNISDAVTFMAGTVLVLRMPTLVTSLVCTTTARFKSVTPLLKVKH